MYLTKNTLKTNILKILVQSVNPLSKLKESETISRWKSSPLVLQSLFSDLPFLTFLGL